MELNENLMLQDPEFQGIYGQEGLNLEGEQEIQVP